MANVALVRGCLQATGEPKMRAVADLEMRNDKQAGQ